MSDEILKIKLDRLMELLEAYNEPHWAWYFQIAQEKLHGNDIAGAKAQIRGAYGGMCSFSDELYFTGASEQIAAEGYQLRDDLYLLCKEPSILEKVRQLFK